MAELKRMIRGSKNSKSGSDGSSDTSSPDTLRNNTYAQFVDLISEGPIGGLVGTGSTSDPNAQLKSIFLQSTVLQDSNGHLNFNGTSFEQRFGYPDQDALKGNPVVQTPYDVSTRVYLDRGPITRTITDENATSVLVVVQVPALFTTDTSSGYVYPWTVSWDVQWRKAGGTWITAESVVLNKQKCTSPYERQTKINLSQDGYPWEVRVVRTAGDNYSQTSANDIYWVSYTTQVEGLFTYPNSALISGRIDASEFGGSAIPSRNYLVDGRQIQIPSNYDPVTRAYSGIWDGTFKNAIPTSSNPAWILYDMLIHNRYGLGQWVDVSKVDKWGLYQIAQYCDQLVPDGFGGHEPRYTLNTQITDRQDAFRLLQQIGTAFRGMSYWSLGQVFSFADMPLDPVKLVTPANVIDGQFEYSATGINARHSVAVIAWNDPGDFYQSAREVYVDDEQVNAFGWREIEVQAFGCTSRGTALRYGKWVIDTEKTATETVEYQASWDHADIAPGNIIAIADPAKAQVRTGGRIKGVTANTVTLDAPFDLTQGQTYQFWCELPDATIFKLPINSVAGAVVSLGGNFATLPNVGAMWTIVGSDVNPRQYRVLNVSETAPNIFKITALFHDPTKYLRVEDDIILEPVQYSRPKSAIAPPTNLTYSENLFFKSGVAQNQLFLSWTPGNDFLSFEYQINGTGPSGPTDYGRSITPNLEIDNPIEGDYTFTIVGVSKAGITSPQLTGTYTVRSWGGNDGPYVSMLEIFGQGNNTNFSGQDCKVTWRNNFPGSTSDVGQEAFAGAGMESPLYRDNVVRIYDTDSNELLRQEVVYVSNYTYTYEHNQEDNQALFARDAQRKFRIEVTVRDNVGRESAPAILVCQNPVPDLVIPTCTGGLDSILVQLLPPSDADFRGFIIWVSGDQSFDPLKTTPSYKGANSLVTLPVTLDDDGFGVFYVRAAAYDAFSATGLNISPPITVNVGGNIFDTTPPAIPSQPVLTSQQVTLADGTIQSNLTITWDAVTSKNLAYYEVQISENGGGLISFPTATNTYSFTDLKPGSVYLVQVRAVSKNLVRSGYSLQTTFIMPLKTTGPGVITNLQAISSLKSAFLTWTQPTDKDLDHAEVWMSPNMSQGSAVLLGATGGSAFTASGLTTGQSYYFFVRVFNTSNVASAFVGPVLAIPGQVQTGDLGDKAIVKGKIADNTITAAQIAPNTITVTQIARQTITVDVIAPLAIDASVIAAGAITNTKIDDGAISTPKIAAGAVTAYTIAAKTITSDNIAANTITGDKIAANTITAGNIVSNTITSDKIAANTITGDRIAANTISAGNIVSNTITANQIAANTITAGQLAANAVTAQKLVAGQRAISVSNLTFGFDKVNSNVGWTSGSIDYIDDNGARQSTGALVANAIHYRGNTIYVYWPVGANGFVYTESVPSTDPTWVLMATYTGGIGVNAVYGATVIDGSNIYTGSIQAAQIAANTITSNEIAANTITAAQIATGTLTADQIKAGSITGDRLNINTSLPASITVGSTGVSIGTVQDQANRPADYINAGTTQIDPGHISISGATTLASWRDGGDNTKISGGNIAANTISANKLTIGSRGLGFSGIQFSFDKTNNIVSWSAGSITYMADDGSIKTVSIAANAIQYSGSTIYIYWQKGGTGLIAGPDNGATLADPTVVLVATYIGNIGINAIYGATQVDGSQISTNSITANQITTNEFITNSAQIRGGIITNTHLAGTITFDKLAGGTLSTSQAIFIGGNNFQFDAVNQNQRIYDGNGTLRTLIGKFPNGGTTDYGLVMYDSSGKVILSTSNGQLQTSDPNAISPSNPITSNNIGKVISSSADFSVYISSLSASKISATSLSSIVANLGTVTAGVVQSSDGKIVLDLNAGTMTISDNS